MYIYASNPYSELGALFMTLMAGSIKDSPAPDFQGIEAWINSEPLSIEELRGKVVLIEFWTYSCINCQRDIPHINETYAKYKDQGLVVVGVHTPEFRFERKLENVQQAVTNYGITYPVALDNDYQTWRAYHNHYWPAKYLVAKDGKVVYFRFGEGAYIELDSKIKELLEN